MKLYKDTKSYGIVSALIGVLCIFAWLVPILGVVTAFGAVLTGAKAIDNEDDGWALAGITLGCLGFILTLLRSGLVYFYG